MGTNQRQSPAHIDHFSGHQKSKTHDNDFTWDPPINSSGSPDVEDDFMNSTATMSMAPMQSQTSTVPAKRPRGRPRKLNPDGSFATNHIPVSFVGFIKGLVSLYLRPYPHLLGLCRLSAPLILLCVCCPKLCRSACQLRNKIPTFGSSFNHRVVLTRLGEATVANGILVWSEADHLV